MRPAGSDEIIDTEFEALLEFMRAERGFDFKGYKRAGLMRRVSKRMGSVRIDGFADYTEYLKNNPEEFVDLFNTILINVTGFFRDRDAWDYIASEVVPRIVGSIDGRSAIRAWSAGCASGEEAYTIAMILCEQLGESTYRDRVKIYATDVDEEALTQSRQGVFTAKDVDGSVPEELVERYFESIDGYYTFRKDLRRSIIFGRNDLVQDPPISKIDLLVSRNTLMYFGAPTQERILRNFHFALTREGFLFLGKSEVLVRRLSLFAPVDVKSRVFAKVPDGRGNGFVQTRTATPEPPQHRTAALQESAFQAVPLAQFVVDHTGALMLANGQARTQFGLSANDIGRPIQDLELSYRPLELRSRIDQASQERHSVTVREVELMTPSGETRYMDVQVAPLITSSGEQVGTSITFSDVTRYKTLQDQLGDSRVRLEAAYEELQSTVEELETTNEELQSTNEELETTNEELQSTNEELETVNEEIQSTNEELETINDEYRKSTEELNEVNAFLEAILTGLQMGVAVVDREMRIEAWNSKAEDLWGVRAGEVSGHHFLNLDIGLPVAELRTPMKRCLAGTSPKEVMECEAVNRRGRSIKCRVTFTPLKRPEDEIRGVIILMDEEA